MHTWTGKAVGTRTTHTPKFASSSPHASCKLANTRIPVLDTLPTASCLPFAFARLLRFPRARVRSTHNARSTEQASTHPRANRRAIALPFPFIFKANRNAIRSRSNELAFRSRLVLRQVRNALLRHRLTRHRLTTANASPAITQLPHAHKHWSATLTPAPRGGRARQTAHPPPAWASARPHSPAGSGRRRRRPP